MDWSLEITKAAEKDIKRLAHPVRQRIFDKLEWLQNNFKAITPTPLHGEFKGFYRLRIGEWRVIYSVERSARLIIIHLIDRRDRIYKTH